MFSLAIDGSCEQIVITSKKYKSSGGEEFATSKGSKSQHIASLLKSHLIKYNLLLEYLKDIRVGLGPGSFTGLRGILSFVKALAYSKNITVFSFTLFDAIRHFYFDEEYPVIVSMDGKQNSIFLSYQKGDVHNLRCDEFFDWLSTYKKVNEFIKTSKTKVICYGSWNQVTYDLFIRQCSLKKNIQIIDCKAIKSLESAFK